MDTSTISDVAKLTPDDYKRINAFVLEELNSLLCDPSIYDAYDSEYWEERQLEVPLSDNEDEDRQIIIYARLGIYYHTTPEDNDYFTGTGCGGEVEFDDWDVDIDNAELYDIRINEWVPVDVDRTRLDLG